MRELPMALLEPHLTVGIPAGAGPFPVVLQMHGCGGVKPMQALYAQVALQAGVAVVNIDSLAPRGISVREAQLTVCTGAQLRGPERAADLIAVVAWLKTQPWADCGRLAATGWSHGGWAVMEALATGDDALADLRLVTLIYPYAGALARTAKRGWPGARPRVLACVGARDAVVGHLGPMRALDRLTADGLEVSLLSLPDATHCFDDDTANDPRSRFRPDLREKLLAAYAAALGNTLTTAGAPQRPSTGPRRPPMMGLGDHSTWGAEP